MEIIYEEFKEALSKIKVLRENANIIEETVQRSVREIIRHVREGKMKLYLSIQKSLMV